MPKNSYEILVNFAFLGDEMFKKMPQNLFLGGYLLAITCPARDQTEVVNV